jgi:hypothetical protein
MEGVPLDFEETCFVCPAGTSPDDFVDYDLLWSDLCAIAQTRRLSSTITARSLAETLSLRRVFDCQARGQARAPKPAGACDESIFGASSMLVGHRKRAAEQEEGESVTALRHGALQLSRHPERGREFVCSIEEGLSAGVCVLVEEPIVSILDCEVHREKGSQPDK